MDGCIQGDEGGGKIRLVSGYTQGVLIGDYPAVSTGITVALVATVLDRAVNSSTLESEITFGLGLSFHL